MKEDNLKNNKAPKQSLMSRSRILVVDDEPEVITFISHALHQLGCTKFHTLSSAEESIQYVKNNPVDIIIMDVVFQKELRDGSSAVHEIHKQFDVPIVYISGYSNDEILNRIKTTKNAYFLQKPFSVEELKFSIEIALFNFIEDSLRKSEKRYRRIIDAISDYIYSVKVANGKVVRTNHIASCESVTGYTPDEFARDEFLWIIIVPEKEREMVRAHFQDILTSHDVSPIEHRIIRKDGKVRWIRNTPVFHFDESGTFTGYDGIVSDITARKMAEEALLAQQEALEELVALRTEHLLVLNNELNIAKEELREKNEKIMWDLHQARKGQELLLPRHDLENEILIADYLYLPLDLVGGDFIAYSQFKEDDHFGVFIGDVTGHGISAALYTASAKAIISRIERSRLMNPRQYLESVNTDLAALVKGNPNAHFMTGQYGFFCKCDNGRISFTFSNAGQPYPVIFRKSTNSIELAKLNGIMLGHFAEPLYDEKSILLDPGDRVYLYTDGITELANDESQELEMQGFMDILFKINQSKISIKDTLGKIMKKADRYRGSMPVCDDIVILGIEIK